MTNTKVREVYPMQTIRLTSAAACEAVGRVLIDAKAVEGGSVADLTYRIVKALGFKLKYE